MKTILWMFVLPLFFTAGLTNESNTDKELITWETKTYDFGEIPAGTPVDARFLLQNNSDQPLVISNVKTSCGCTASDYTKEPISPGMESSITATYNAKKPGPFTKTISVFTNFSEEATILKITGTVQE